jgi:predicted permease
VWSDLIYRLRALVRRKAVENELDEELRFHFERQVDKYVAAGMARAEAARRARMEFGGVESIKEECRDARGVRFFETLWQDVRYAIRGFRRTPGFAVTVVATIALGLGLNTSVFTIFNAYVLRPLSVPDPYSLYRFTWRNRNGDGHEFTWREFEDFRKQNRAFSEVAGLDSVMFVRVEGHTLLGQLVTGSYFPMLGVHAALGRTLVPEDAAAPGLEPVVVLSSKAWRNKFASDPGIVGKKVVIHGYSLEVVGVVQEGFTGVTEVPLDFWAPLTMAPQLEEGASLFGLEEPQRLRILGRLRHELTVREAGVALTTWAQQRTSDGPDGEKATGAILRSEATTLPLEPEVVAGFSPIIVAFGLVLLIACANVANMMLARGMARQREIGIRLAIGAARARLIRQLLTESVLLALPAAAAGFAISKATIDWGQRLMFATLPRGYAEFVTVLPLEPDERVFGFMLLASVSAALLFGLMPAIQATRSNVMQAARGEFTTDFRPARLRNALIIGQVAVSVLLLICAAVLLRADKRLQSLDVGLETRGVIEIEIQDKLRSKVMRAVATEPVVESVAAASKVPFTGYLPWMPVTPDSTSERGWAQYMHVTPEYFPMFQVPILRGRNFTRDEGKAGVPVVVISQGTAKRLWPGKDALGRSLRIEQDPEQRRSKAENHTIGVPSSTVVRVIGIARDAVNGYIGDATDKTCVYFPGTAEAAGYVLFVRVHGDAEVARRRLDAALAASTPGAVDQIHTMDEILTAQLFPFRAAYWVSSAIGGLALLLTLSGIYGVLSYLVTQRTKEIGIRVALGASTSSVAGLVLRQSLRLTGVGAAVGAMAALGVSYVLASQLEMFMFDTFDGVAYGTVVAMVMAAAACAAYFPCRRAARIEPITTLRYD